MALPLQRSFDELGTPLFDVTFCVVDLETTGGSPAGCEITEVGAVKVRHGEVLGTFQTLVNPGGPIPPYITVLTGITHAMVVRAPPIEEVLPSFLEFCGDSVIVGHNVRFDLGFLNAAAERLGYSRLSHRWVDTAALARRLIRTEVRNLRLATLAAYLRSPVTPNHRAFDDARATMHVFHGLLERAGSLGVTALEDLLALPRARGSAHYSKIHLARELPRRPGVYLFRDRQGAVLYVGKAKNLRTRVSSYFYGDERRSIANLLREMDTIEHQVCTGELEAGVTELRLIHAHRPRHNRASRPPKANHFVTLTGGRFPRLSLTRTLRRDARTVLGPFRSRRAAEAVMTAIWDAVPVRRCAGKPGERAAPCAPAQLGVALCPCDGTLDPKRYSEVVDRLVCGVEQNARLLLEPLEERMRRMAADRRFEEAAWLRDRHRALAKALETRRRWSALRAAGRLEILNIDGERALVDQGRLVATWRDGLSPPLLPLDAEPREPDPVPPDVAVEAEMRLLWTWMTGGSAVLVEAERPLALPAVAIPQLIIPRGDERRPADRSPRRS